jgi:hypothetical protein
MTCHTCRTITITTDHPNWRRSRTAVAAGALAVLLGSALLASCARAGVAGDRDATAAQPATGGTASPTTQHAAGSLTGSAITLDGTHASVPVPGKPTVAYFYAVGCTSCAQALLDIGATRGAAPAGTAYQAVDINSAGSPSAIRGFLADARTDGFALLRDPGNRLAGTYQVTALGTTVVFDAAGRQVWRGIDPSTATLAAALTKTKAAR